MRMTIEAKNLLHNDWITDSAGELLAIHPVVTDRGVEVDVIDSEDLFEGHWIFDERDLVQVTR